MHPHRRTRQSCPQRQQARTITQPARTHHHRRPTGIVAGAVLRAARQSAGASTATLAAACGVSERTVRSPENGSRPLASAAAAHLAQLEDALTTLEPTPRLPPTWPPLPGLTLSSSPSPTPRIPRACWPTHSLAPMPSASCSPGALLGASLAATAPMPRQGHC
ncbi:MAG TPA: hypothetical protein DHU96_18620 [Actinobacteria bacterium]|nr:hypothetical protein [Actinomycetota bacterium]